MSAFVNKSSPKAPSEFSVILQAEDKSKVNLYRDICYKRLGKPIAPGQDGSWFERNGYFFFRSRNLAAEFKLGVNVWNTEQHYHRDHQTGDPHVDSQHHNRGIPDGPAQEILVLQAKIRDAFETK